MPNIGRLGAENLEDIRNSFRKLGDLLRGLTRVNISVPEVPFDGDFTYPNLVFDVFTIYRCSYWQPGGDRTEIALDVEANLVSGADNSILFRLPFPPKGGFKTNFGCQMANGGIEQTAQAFVAGRNSQLVEVRLPDSSNFSTGALNFTVNGTYEANNASL